jgi:SAM-dependent methyltransferase
MSETTEALNSLLNEELESLILSASRDREIKKCTLRPLEIKGQLAFQESLYKGNQVFHKNLTKEEAVCRVDRYLEEDFGQLQAEGGPHKLLILVSKKGKRTVKLRKRIAPGKPRKLQHNRKKRYILEEGRPVDFLVDLGVMTKEGRVVQAYFDKFRQINRFLEFVEDILPELPQDREICILDFGCGKSYLTFALYYYLRELLGRPVQITGLDLKKEVIEHCRSLKEKYGFDRLEFLQGDIEDYQGKDKVDMVVTLHACDTATDFALYKAVKWNAKVILSVPCCQHELNRTLKNEALAPVLQFGLLKERMAALATDGMRAELLKTQGYAMQVLEFIDMEHTPKNILLRGVYTGKKASVEGYLACKELLGGGGITLERLLEADADSPRSGKEPKGDSQ